VWGIGLKRVYTADKVLEPGKASPDPARTLGIHSLFGSRDQNYQALQALNNIALFIWLHGLAWLFAKSEGSDWMFDYLIDYCQPC
jgi:hypothetical protein